MDYCDYELFGLSFWWHPFTAADTLVSKWCNAKFLQICSDEETNSSTSWMAWGWVNFKHISIFWVNNSFKRGMKSHIKLITAKLQPTCGKASSSSLVRAMLGRGREWLWLWGSSSPLSLLPVEMESGSCRSSSHNISSVSEAGCEPSEGRRSSTSRGSAGPSDGLPLFSPCMCSRNGNY